MTPKATEFASHNTQTAIISGQWLPPYSPPEEAVKLRYRFEDGSIRTLRKADVESLRNAGIEPRWQI